MQEVLVAGKEVEDEEKQEEESGEEGKEGGVSGEGKASVLKEGEGGRTVKR